MPWTRLSASCSSSSSLVCSLTKLCLRLGSAFSIGDGARDEPEPNDNSPEISLFSGSRCYVAERNAFLCSDHRWPAFRARWWRCIYLRMGVTFRIKWGTQVFLEDNRARN